jgi:hypothetical protein
MGWRKWPQFLWNRPVELRPAEGQFRVDKRRSHLPDSSRCPRTQGVQTSVNKVQSYVNLDNGPGVGADAREIV